MLEVLGVSTVAERVYMTLLAEPSLGVTGIARRLELSESEIRKALDELIDLALLTGSTAESGVRVVGPTVALAALVARVDAEIAHRQRQLNTARLAVSELVERHEKAQWRDQVVRFDGVEAVRSRIDELAAEATTDCLSLNPTVAQTSDAKSASAPLNERMLARGVGMRSIYQDSFRNDPRLVRHARAFTALGGELRTAPVIPLLMIIYDRSVALVPVDPDNSRLGAHEIRSPGMVTVALALFEQMWSGARPFEERVTATSVPASGAEVPDAQIRVLLRVLAIGGTDEAVARKLGVSVRTAKRLSKELMESLGARSRFEAGIKAAQRGWI